jgi:hypothetical protein
MEGFTMSHKTIIYTKYLSGNDFGGSLTVDKFSMRNTGTAEKPTNRIEIYLEGKGTIKNARMYLDFDIAVPLARTILGITEGYIFRTESTVG